MSNPRDASKKFKETWRFFLWDNLKYYYLMIKIFKGEILHIYKSKSTT
jgi:hypothetical protein